MTRLRGTLFHLPTTNGTVCDRFCSNRLQLFGFSVLRNPNERLAQEVGNGGFRPFCAFQWRLIDGTACLCRAQHSPHGRNRVSVAAATGPRCHVETSSHIDSVYFDIASR